MNVTLRPLTVTDGPQLYSAVDSSRLHLTNLTWSATATVESVSDYVAAANANTDELHGIFVGDQLAGCITLRSKGAVDDIGYWLGHQYRDQGVMTEAVRQAVDGNARPIVARTLHGNTASRKILLRNEFVEIDRDDTWIHYQRRAVDF